MSSAMSSFLSSPNNKPLKTINKNTLPVVQHTIDEKYAPTAEFGLNTVTDFKQFKTIYIEGVTDSPSLK